MMQRWLFCESEYVRGRNGMRLIGRMVLEDYGANQIWKSYMRFWQLRKMTRC